MDLNFKYSAVAVLAFCVSSTASAGSYMPMSQPCMASNVSIPCEHTGWDIAAELIYIEPMTNDYWFADRFSVSSSNVTTMENLFSDADFDFGFRLEGSFHFNTGNDFTANWLYYNNGNTTSNAIDVTVPGQKMRLRLPSANLTLVANVIDSDVSSNLNVVNLEFGQHIDVGQDVDLRYHFGVQYVNVDEHQYIRLYDNVPALKGQIATQSQFEGIGPRVGIDAYYTLGNGFNLIGRASIAALVGDLESSVIIDNYISATARDDVLESERIMTSSAASKLGMSYSTDCMNGVMILEGGWQWAGYFNTVRHRFTDSSNGLMQPTADFTLHGPYAMLKFLV